MAFITPLGHPVNVLVMSPGGYSFRDYVRVGLPLTLILSAVVLIVLPLVWGL
ncbi:MAG: anion permease [bacterium]|nr:anion permease [bacterium]